MQIFYLRLQKFCFYFIVQAVQFTKHYCFTNFYVVQSLYNVSFDKTCVLHFSFIIIPFVTVIRNVSFEYTLSDYMIILSSEYIVHSTVDQQVQEYI